MSNAGDRSQPLMPIGMFSRASLLSIKALRSYHEQGILIPASIDPETGYRSYHPGQLGDAAVLSRLRKLDLPLALAKEILLARDPDVTRKVLGEHQVTMMKRLAETELIVEELQRAALQPTEQTPVHIRTIEHQYALAVSATITSEQMPDFLGRAFQLLDEGVTSLGFVTSGPGSALYTAAIHDHEAEPVTAYVPVVEPQPIPDPTRGLSIIEIPAQQLAVIVHRGSYESIGETYASLGAWVAHRNADGTLYGPSSLAPVREIYNVSVPDTDDPTAYRTDICWPV